MPNIYRLRIQLDPEPELTDPWGDPLPGSKANYLKAPMMLDDQPLSYSEYCRTFGNPDNHVVLGAILERKCPCCESWVHCDSLWRLDFMHTDPEAWTVNRSFEIHPKTAEADLKAIPGYLREVAVNMLNDLGGKR